MTWKKLMENDCHELEWKLTTVELTLMKGAPGNQV